MVIIYYHSEIVNNRFEIASVASLTGSIISNPHFNQKKDDILCHPLICSRYDDACFSYAADYLDNEAAQPISLSLPLGEDSFFVDKTKYFFEGLLPEGFTRRSVAQQLRVDEMSEGISTALKESAEELEIVGVERVRMIMKLVLPKVIKGYKMYSKL